MAVLTSPERAGAGRNGDRPPDSHPRPAWALRALAGLAVLAVAVYGAACVIYNMPNSPMKVRIGNLARVVMMPWFEQDWQLFAPTPSTANDHIMVTARLARPGGGVETTAPRDIEYPIEDLPLGDHVLPTKQPGITLAIQEIFGFYRNQLQAIDKAAAPSVRPRLRAALDRKHGSDFDRLARIMSYEVHRWYPDRRILQMRASLTQTPITPFSERWAPDRPSSPATTLLTTDWLNYQPGVGG